MTETIKKSFEDVDLNHPWVKQYRLPVVHSPHPRYYYVLALAVPEESDQWNIWNLSMPTDEEVRIVASYLEYRVSELGYYPRIIEKMRERELDIDSGINTTTLMRRTNGYWAYQKATWVHGPWPFLDAPQKSLVELLDHLEKGYNANEPVWPSWAAWKQEHGIA